MCGWVVVESCAWGVCLPGCELASSFWRRGSSRDPVQGVSLEGSLSAKKLVI